MKKLFVFMVGLLVCGGSLWGMNNTQKKKTNYYLKFDGAVINSSRGVIGLSSFLSDLLNETTLVEQETETEIKIVLPLDAVMNPIKKFIATNERILAALKLFVEYGVGRLKVSDLSVAQLLDFIVLADALSATKNEAEKFDPQRDVLHELMCELIRRIERGGEKLFADFWSGNGFLRSLFATLPDGLRQSILDCTLALCKPAVVATKMAWAGPVLELMDGRIAACFGDNRFGEIRILQWGPDGMPMTLQVLSEHKGYIGALIALQDGRLVSGSDDATMSIWSPGKKGIFKEQQVIWGVRRVSYIEELSNGSFFAAFCDGTIRFYEPKKDGTFRDGRIWRDPEGREINHMIRLKDGTHMYVALDHTIKALEQGEDGQFVARQVWHDDSRKVGCLIELRDGNIVVGLSNDEQILILQRSQDGTLVEKQVLAAPEGTENNIIQLGDGRLMSAGDDGSIRVWQQNNNGLFVVRSILRAHKGEVRTLLQLSDGRILSCDWGGRSRGREVPLSDRAGKVFIWNLDPLTVEQVIVLRALMYRVSAGMLGKLWNKWGRLYEKIFQDRTILNVFASLPDNTLRNFMVDKGADAVYAAIDQLLADIRHDMQDANYKKLYQKELVARLAIVERLLKLLNLKEKDRLYQSWLEVKGLVRS
jgi:WD40 repeat protein